MQYSSCLSSISEVIVLDTSVIINLYASGEAARIVKILPNNVVIAENVFYELRGEYNDSSEQKELLEKLQRQRYLEVVKLQDEDLSLYSDLVSGFRSLDDGEAATLTLAVNNGYTPVLDERKGLRRFQDLKPGAISPYSMDIFFHPAVLAEFGREGSSDLIFNALTLAKMRVQEHHLSEVIELIGKERAVHCNSLPNYKVLKRELSPSSN